MAYNFKNAKRVNDPELLRQRMSLLGATPRSPQTPYGIHARAPLTPEEMARQHEELLKQRADFAGAKLVPLSKKGGAANNSLPNVNDGESDTTEVMNPDDLPHPNEMGGEIRPAMENSLSAPAAPQGGRRRRRRTVRTSGGTHRPGHKGRRASKHKRRHSSKHTRRHLSRRR